MFVTEGSTVRSLHVKPTGESAELDDMLVELAQLRETRTAVAMQLKRAWHENEQLKASYAASTFLRTRIVLYIGV